MLARYALVGALLKIKAFDAVRVAAEHIRDMLRLCRSDNMGFRDLLPALYLRLGRDQEAYDFVKWWATIGRESDYDWLDTALPYLDVVNANAFESPHYLYRKYASLTDLLCVVLLKIKLLLDLEALQNSAFLGGKLPHELVDRTKNFIPSSEIISQKVEIMYSTDNTDKIRSMSGQVDVLFDAVTKANAHFWPALTNPGPHLKARPEAYSRGSIQEMQLKLQYWFDPWNETPGAIDIIKAKLKT
ncbi:MAG: hypothetical protein Q9225_003972 [Loekoesia sp. 1 TL-2023]